MGSHARSIVPAALLLAALPAFCQAPAARARAIATSAPQPQTAPPPPAAPPSPLDQPAMPPTLDLAQGRLTIHATNSSLRTILDQLGALTGTKIEGLTKDERVFGVYGPGNPQEVLAALLDGTGYNVVISGRRPDGAPREVALSLQTAGDTTSQPTGLTQAAQDDTDDEAPVSPAFNGFPGNPQQPGAAPSQPAQPGQVRTPQQMLQELQRMREQAAQSQPQPQQ